MITYDEIEATIGPRLAEQINKAVRDGYAVQRQTCIEGSDATAIDVLLIGAMASQITASEDLDVARRRARHCLSMLRDCFEAALEIRSDMAESCQSTNTPNTHAIRHADRCSAN